MNCWCRRVGEAGAWAIAVLLPLCFNPYAAAPFEPAKVTLLLAVVGVMALACVASAAAAPRRALAVRGKSSHNPLLWPALLYVAAFALATVAAVDPWRSLEGLSYNPHGALTTLALAAFFLLLAHALRSFTQVERIVTALLVGSAPIAFYGLAQYLHLDPLHWATNAVSPVHSTVGSSLYLGGYLAMVAPFTLSRIVASRERSEALRYGLILALQILVLLLTRARGAWLGFVAALLLFLGYLAWRRHSHTLALGSILALFAGAVLFVLVDGTWVAALSPAHDPEGNRLLSARAGSAQVRLAIWEDSLALVPGRWLLGYGPDGFSAAFAAQRASTPDPRLPARQIVDDPHNIFLQHLISGGIAGLAAFIALLGAFCRLAVRALRRAPSGPSAVTAVAAVSSVVAFLICTQANPDVITLSALFWLDLALTAALHSVSREPIDSRATSG